jgi:hypothetical protein
MCDVRFSRNTLSVAYLRLVGATRWTDCGRSDLSINRQLSIFLLPWQNSDNQTYR